MDKCGSYLVTTKHAFNSNYVYVTIAHILFVEYHVAKKLNLLLTPYNQKMLYSFY